MSATDISEIVAPVFFPNLSIQTFSRIVLGYRTSNLWAQTPKLPVAPYVRLKAALLSGGLISYDVPFDIAVDETVSDLEANNVVQY